MDFNDTPQEAEFRAKAHAWLAENAEPINPDETGPDMLGEREDPETIQKAKDWQARKFDAGWAVLTWPKEYGGQGLGRMENVIWNQEEAKFKTPPNIYTIGHGMLGPTIMTHGTDEQKKKYIPDMARGQEVWCQLFSEPAAGSDLAGLRSTAVRDGDEWVLNGQKIWSTGAHYSKWGMIVVRTDPNVAKHAGLTYFIVDMESPGIEIRPIKQINGGSGFNEVFFTDVRIPAENQLGAEGDGWRVALTTLMNERVAIGAGAGAGRFRDLLRLARQTRMAGKPAIEDSAVRQKLASIYIRSKGLQYTGMRTLSALSQGATPGPEGSIGKAVGGPLSQEIASFAIELQGAAGALLDENASPMEGLWQNAYLGAPGIRIAGGTDEILKNIIAERVLRMPPEIRVDKEIAFRDVPTGPAPPPRPGGLPPGSSPAPPLASTLPLAMGAESTSEARTEGVHVHVSARYSDEHSSPLANHWFFLYTIRITNEGRERVQLLSRHWIITDATGEVREVQGEGVVGQQPVLEPGEAFEYTSGCPLETPFGAMEGTYHMVREDGSDFEARIARFELSEPASLH